MGCCRVDARGMGCAWGSGWAAAFTALAFFLLPLVVDGMCPPKCACDDDALAARCNDAGLDVFPIQLNPDLKAISIRGNRIRDVQYTLGIYAQLRALDLADNRITSLGERNFELQKNLQLLNVSGNQIVRLSKDTFLGLQELRVLDLSRNVLQVLDAAYFHDTPQLAVLHVSGNRITLDDAGLEKLRSLEVLDLQENQIMELPVVPESIRELYLGSNYLENVRLPPLADLRVLGLEGNLITQLEDDAFSGLDVLQALNLALNNLSAVPTEALARLPTLEVLDLSENQIDAIEPLAFRSLFSLRRLELSKLRRLSRLHARSFVDNTRLETLSLDHSGLYMVPRGLLRGNPALRVLSVAYGRFDTLPADAFPLDQLRHLSLGGNPWSCNCSLAWLARLARDAVAANGSSESLLLDEQAIRCQEPLEFHEWRIADVPEGELSCDQALWVALCVAALSAVLVAATCAAVVLGRRRRRDSKALRNLGPPLTPNPPVLMLLRQPPPAERYPSKLDTWEPIGDSEHFYEAAYPEQFKRPHHMVYV